MTPALAGLIANQLREINCGPITLFVWRTDQWTQLKMSLSL
jgi:hypothetical protein